MCIVVEALADPQCCKEGGPHSVGALREEGPGRLPRERAGGAAPCEGRM